MHLRSEKLICWRSQDTYQGTRYHGGGTRGRCGGVAAVAERRSLPREIRFFIVMSLSLLWYFMCTFSRDVDLNSGPR